MKKYFVLALCAMLSLGIMTGCKKKEKEPKVKERTGDITYFRYYHGGGWSGAYYEITSDDDKYLLTYECYACELGNLEVEISEDVVSDIADIINEYKIYEWDGFDKSAEDVMDGDGFSIEVKYSSGESIKAHGYMIYPENFRDASKALGDYLYKLCIK